MCEAWEADVVPKKAKNPYHTVGLSEWHNTFYTSMFTDETPLALSEADIRKELAKEEEACLSNGEIALHETSPLAFLALGMELEESQ